MIFGVVTDVCGDRMEGFSTGYSLSKSMDRCDGGIGNCSRLKMPNCFPKQYSFILQVCKPREELSRSENRRARSGAAEKTDRHSPLKSLASESPFLSYAGS